MYQSENDGEEVSSEIFLLTLSIDNTLAHIICPSTLKCDPLLGHIVAYETNVLESSSYF